MSQAFNEVPVVILCGGRGVVLGEGQSTRLNKALVRVNGKPLFWWVVIHYALHGGQSFLLATGLQTEYFHTVLKEDCGAQVDPALPDTYWVNVSGLKRQLRLVPAPVEANTAQRLLACKSYLAGVSRFALTYSDTLSDVDLSDELRFHAAQGTVGSLVSTQCPVRFRILGKRQGETIVRAFAHRPVIEAAAINGGYYLFTDRIWDHAYGLDGTSALEALPLERLVSQQQLTAFEHRGQWQHCDAERDLAPLRHIAHQLAARLAG